tara:strand:- start:8678 stop:9103 length:426 start_codon:yes stop_codon:yes gene_type:complete
MPFTLKLKLGALAVAGLMLTSTPLLADYEAGVAAYNSGNYRAAMMEFTVDANQGHVQAQRRLGEMYRTGQGTTPDFVQAIKWLTLAYLSGERDLDSTLELLRDSVSEQQLVEGEQLALSWLEEANRVIFADDDTSSLYETF